MISSGRSCRVVAWSCLVVLLKAHVRCLAVCYAVLVLRLWMICLGEETANEWQRLSAVQWMCLRSAQAAR
jgi:hypothetical protein